MQQKYFNEKLSTIDGVEVVMDDIVVHGRDEQEHSRLRVVLERVKSINLKLNKAKCILAKQEVNYVGHLLTGEGLKPPNGSKQSQR